MNNRLPINRNIAALRMTDCTYRDMVWHCLQEKPLEACGLLSGNDGLAKRCWPIVNIDQSPVSFTMDMEQLDSALKQMERAGEQLLAVFHSHPASIPYPSAYDIEHAAYPCSYIIVSLSRLRPRVRSYRIEGNTAQPEPIQIVSEQGMKHDAH
ncbi:M67 family metallopeptidase [Paenibacillus alvei]|uniref:M67 family metallopeptidase n=1 Tax=Paenibacillus alvei TaxID=44250 RepID=A0ABT4H4F0_PAEAL|nr:M67 family metallopeptidase [Paenibacillus alvei]EJW16618.1 putative metal-dependent protease of the PAD1/JAB1 superfamily [Paenibacillus alvei DSM 29]MCY7484841.1 M67 family metallopeptidase [Paenibacillus alvei]MCY9541649.1 M67 family metallopeptidase [Paenibacillus alvei]MCY9704135.1 M67 family metallopeptidase [Paenibacillus alvei]MCY9736862.1 M67 family metallopeptidase [Paenibacillus alvei]